MCNFLICKYYYLKKMEICKLNCWYIKMANTVSRKKQKLIFSKYIVNVDLTMLIKQKSKQLL